MSRLIASGSEADMEQITLMPVRTPCNRICEVEWGSLRCMEKNGMMYDHARREFLRNDNGQVLISNNRECDWKE